MKPYKYYLNLLILILLISCSEKQETKPVFLKSQYKSRNRAPFSDAVAYDRLLFLTGQIGKDHKTGKMVEGGIKEETKQVISNIEEVLLANGSDLEHVLKCTVILSDINDFSAMNEVYRSYFSDKKPARTTFAANLVAGAKIEIEVIAVKK